MGDTKYVLSLGNLGAELDSSFFLGGLCFLGRLFHVIRQHDGESIKWGVGNWVIEESNRQPRNMNSV